MSVDWNQEGVSAVTLDSRILLGVWSSRRWIQKKLKFHKAKVPNYPIFVKQDEMKPNFGAGTMSAMEVPENSDRRD